jgi:hypothetical protein
MLVYVLILGTVAAWKFIPRPWHPSITLQTGHHLIYSTATRQQTEETAHTLNLLYLSYSNQLSSLTTFQRLHPKLKVKLFKDRAEFRRINPNLGWAEAFYREPYCRAYFSAAEINPYHWMLHESVHQLDHEVAHLNLEKWLEEGLAEYFSTSRLTSNGLALGQIDPNTYPVWWMDELATAPDLAENIRNGSVIPLRAIITGRGGPSLNTRFNLYYLHWWTLTHFLFESPRCRKYALELVRRGGSLEAFEQILGPVDQMQVEWHNYVRHLKSVLSGQDLRLTQRPLIVTQAAPQTPQEITPVWRRPQIPATQRRTEPMPAFSKIGSLQSRPVDFSELVTWIEASLRSETI